MGHQRLGKLPATHKWKTVVSMIGAGADVAAVAAASAKAAEKSLTLASNDPVLLHVTWLLTQIPLAAREPDFVARLHALGILVEPEPTLVDICVAVTIHLDAMMRRQRRINDFGEIAQIALVESLTAVTAPAMPMLAGLSAPADDTRAALRGLATAKQFGILARDFYARLTRRILDYYLSRELPSHVGVNQRFRSLREHSAFEMALARHCHEAALIVEKYAGDWFSKTRYEGGINEKNARDFARYGFTKIIDELEVRREVRAIA